MCIAVKCERIGDCNVRIDDVPALIERSFGAVKDCVVGNGLFDAVRVDIV